MNELLPTHMSVENPLALGIGAGVGLLAAAALVGVHHAAKEKYGTPVVNDALLEHTLHQVGADTSAAKRANTLYRTSALAGTFLAASTAAGLYVGGITHEVEVPNPDSEIVFVLDASSTMNARDMTDQNSSNVVSRSEAAEQAFTVGTANFSGKIALIQVGSNTNLFVPMSKDFSSVYSAELADNTDTKIDPNGGDIVSGIKEAAAQLPIVVGGDVAPGVPTQREGTIVVVSDGTHSNTQQQVDETIQGVKAQGIDITVIVPGTSDGTYKLGSSDVPAGIAPDSFNAVGDKKSIVVSEPVALTAAISDITKHEGTKTVVEPYDLPWQISGGVAVAALGVLGLRIAKRKI